MLITLTLPQINVDTTVPMYLPQAPGSALTVPFRVHFVGSQVTDLLVDVDFSQNRLISIQPGPNSSTTVWEPLAGQGQIPPDSTDPNYG